MLLESDSGTERVSPTRIRLELGIALSLSLEFLLAADIVETILAPSLEQLGILGGIAVIRTGLNYFLGRELAQESQELQQEAATRVEQPVAAAAVGSAGRE